MSTRAFAELDRMDRRLLDLLQHDAGVAPADMAEQLGLSATTCWRRISRLQDEGFVKARVALLDRLAIDLPIMVFCHVKLSSQGREAIARFEQAIRRYPEVLECYTMMGEWDFLLRVVARSISAYEAFFLDHLSKLPGVQSVNSSIALSTIKETTELPVL